MRPSRNLPAAVSDSIAINGVCLTVAEIAGRELVFDVVRETLKRSTLGGLRPGDPVNIEPSLAVGAPLGGHFVQGHVDAVAPVLAIHGAVEDRSLKVECPVHVRALIAEKGAVALDGVSLTVAECGESAFTVKIVPYTWESTTLGGLSAGHRVNIETDMLARYVAKLLGHTSGGLTEDTLRRAGF